MRLALGLVVAGLLVACTSTPEPAAGVASACAEEAPPARYDHVVWIVMENHHRGDVIGSRSAPFATRVAAGCATVERYAQVGRPSLPNYLGATSGATHGVRDDASPARHPITADNLFRQVRRAGGRARTYAETMPAPCTLTSRGRYAVKHVPAAYYVGADDRAACRRDVLPLGTTDSGPLASDLADGTLAPFTMVVPDLCSDTHNCSVATGDRWLERWVGAITASPTWREGRTALFVLWDEPTPMPFLALAPSVRPGTVVRTPIDHYAVLRTTEELLGLPLLGAARTAPSLRAVLPL